MSRHSYGKTPQQVIDILQGIDAAALKRYRV